MTFRWWKSRSWKSGGCVCATALTSFTAGWVIAAGLVPTNRVKADSNHVFEIRVYHALPGKLPTLESRFRDTTSKLLAKHDLKAVGYWTTEGNDPTWGNTFIFLLDHPSQEDAKKNWAAFVGDPAFQQVVKSEQADKTVDKVDSTYMHPTDFSPMK